MIDIPREAIAYQAELTREARYAFGMDAPVALLAGQITQESGWRSDVCSKYACGLAQFTPGTAAWLAGINDRVGDAEPLNPHWALRALVTYDHLLHDAANPADSDCDRWQFAFSDYNGGTKWRVKRQTMSPQPGNYAITAAFNPGVSKSNQQQNQDYPFRIAYRWQPIFVSWVGPLICLGKAGA